MVTSTTVFNASACHRRDRSVLTLALLPCLAVPAVMQLLRGGADLSQFPKLAAYAELMAARPSVESTWPPHWRGSTGDFFQKQ